MPVDNVDEISEIIFNRFAIKAAQRRALVDSWVAGVKDRYTSVAENGDKSDDEEDVETFHLESHSEIIGLGVDLSALSQSERSRLDPHFTGEDASTAFLRERLLGHKKPTQQPAPPSSQRTKLGMHGLEPGFSPYTHKASGGGGGPGEGTGKIGARRNDDDEDDEEEIGRSGIGGKSGRDGTSIGNGGKEGKEKKKKKAKRKGQAGGGEEGNESGAAAGDAGDAGKEVVDVGRAEKDASPNEGDDGDEDDGVEGRAGTNKSGTSAGSQAAPLKKKRRAVSYLDELLAKKSKQKKR